MTLSMKGLYVTLRITCTQHNNALHYAERRILFIVMLSVIMPNVVMLTVVLLSVLATSGALSRLKRNQSC